jgi:hypothetical protein
MSAAPHQNAKILKALFSYRKAGFKPGFFVSKSGVEAASAEFRGTASLLCGPEEPIVAET